jgi:hypothetical protein
VRNLVEKSLQLQTLRILNAEILTRRDLMTVEGIDLPDDAELQM